MATGDKEWVDWLKTDRLPRMTRYYSTTPEGGSREGTGYGESHRDVFTIAKMWRDYDGTEVLPQEFIDNSILYWTHATTPDHRWVALIGDHTRAHGRVDSYHRDIIDNALQLAKDPEAIAIGHWQINRLPKLSPYFYSLVLRDYPDDGHPPTELEYHAKGAGHFFARSSWESEATYVYFTAGKLDEAHQQDDQGAFAVWDGEWQTCSDSPWTHGGIAQGPNNQNVVRFGERQKRKTESTMDWSKAGGVLRVEMDLSPAVGREWKRVVEWAGNRKLSITDTLDTTDAEFGFEKPSADDDRPPSISNARAAVTQTAAGFKSEVTW